MAGLIWDAHPHCFYMRWGQKASVLIWACVYWSIFSSLLAILFFVFFVSTMSTSTTPPPPPYVRPVGFPPLCHHHYSNPHDHCCPPDYPPCNSCISQVCRTGTTLLRFNHCQVETSTVCVRQTRPLVFLDTRPKQGWATDLCASRAGPVRPDHRLQSHRGFRAVRTVVRVDRRGG